MSAAEARSERSLLEISLGKIALWVLTVLVFAFIPNLIHWGVKAIDDRPSLWDLADMFLYIFVLWATLLAEVITDSSSKRKPPSPTMVASSFVMGIFSALGYAGAQVKTGPSGSLGLGLAALLVFLIVITILVCALYKVPLLIGTARAEFASQALGRS